MAIELGLLFGGKSGAHDVSIEAAKDIREALQTNKYKKKYKIIPFYIQKNGHFSSQEVAKSHLEKNISDSQKNQSELCKIPWTIPSELATIDICFSTILCGPGSGDGSIQGLLTAIQIPYVGSSVLGAAIGADKITMKRVLAYANIPQVEYKSIDKSELFSHPSNLEIFCNEIEESFQYPYFIKPSRLGSSIGISMAENREELKNGLRIAADYDHRIIVEKGVRARELSCAVLGNVSPQLSILAEKIYGDKFNSYDAKYQENQGRFELIKDLPEKTVQKIKELALLTFKTTACLDACRIDFFVLEDNQTVIVNEINTVFGLKKRSMFSFLWQSMGIDFPTLLDKLITLALDRENTKKISLELAKNNRKF